MEKKDENIKDIILKDNSLDKDYKDIISKVSYKSLMDLHNDINLYQQFGYIELFDIISTIMIFVEGIELNSVKLDGQTKKNLVLFLGRFFIKTYVKNSDFIKLYDQYADDIIEKIVYNSVFLNIGNVVTKNCCKIF